MWQNHSWRPIGQLLPIECEKQNHQNRLFKSGTVAAHQSATDHRGCIISLRCKVGDWKIIVALPALVRGHLGGLWLEPLVSSNMATIATTNDTFTYVQVTC